MPAFCHTCLNLPNSVFQTIPSTWKLKISAAVANIVYSKKSHFVTPQEIIDFTTYNWNILSGEDKKPLNLTNKISAAGFRLYNRLQEGRYFIPDIVFHELHPESTECAFSDKEDEENLKFTYLDFLPETKKKQPIAYSVPADEELEIEIEVEMIKDQEEDNLKRRKSTRKRKTRSAKEILVDNENDENSLARKKIYQNATLEDYFTNPFALCVSNDHPFDNDLFIYKPCEKDPVLSFIYRLAYPVEGPHLCSEHSSPNLCIDKFIRCYAHSPNYKYRSVMSNYGVSSGSYYFEVWSNGLGNFRCGVGKYSACLQAPVGFDDVSYGLRDVDGSKIHRSVRTSYSSPIKANDVIGILMEFEQDEPIDQYRSVTQSRIPIKVRGLFFFEEKVVPQTKSEKTKSLKITFFYNGRSAGEAFKVEVDKNDVYHAMISAYGGATVAINAGPVFVCPPENVLYKPLSDVSTDIQIDETIND
ncbi:hypothetical protein ROZALSC1DRAFT_29931, partial [Rozella allomycis CSF55]